MLLSGAYDECIQAAHEAVSQNRYGEAWPLVKTQAELVVGKADAAAQTVAAALTRYNWSIRLRWYGREAALRCGDDALAKKLLAEIMEHVQRFNWRYTDPEEIVVIGRVELLSGADARDVLDQRFERAKQRNARSREPWLAIGELALEKDDDALAASIFGDALKQLPGDPDLHFGLARALASSDSKAAAENLEAALQVNPKHVPSLLDRAERLIDAESYEAADKLLDTVLAINRHQPEAWALRSVIAHLTNDPVGERVFREKALSPWTNNPVPDHLIGRKLSQNYRFAEGAAYQRRVLEIDPTYVPAQRQLAQDLLRLGTEEEGWKLAQSAHDRDSYSVATFNLLELRDALREFVTLEDERFLLRMEKQEAQLYGAEALALLNRARETLCEKYALPLRGTITVEIFPDQDDFAVRTFGMPAVSGYLGVCFGRVITANSPSSRREHPSNWQSVLWHEFCHVITLEATHNRIPRWLSEGISVYEELQANRAWGQHMDPRSREHILGGGLTPLSQLSGAFLNPASGWHLQFAYFESALAVEFLVERYGQEALRNVLSDLAAGLTINVALDRRCDALASLEAKFAEFVRQKAESLAPGVDWNKPDLQRLLVEDNEALEAWVRDHPRNFIGQMALAERLLENREWTRAEPVLRRLIELYPNYVGGDNAYEKLAKVLRELNRPDEERQVLNELTRLDANAVAARLRLIELQRSAKDWEGVELTSQELLAIDPLLQASHEAAALAAERLGKTRELTQALERLVILEPDDPADVYYRLAQALHSTGRSREAKRQILKALEEAPRFREAQRLLLKIRRTERDVTQ